METITLEQLQAEEKDIMGSLKYVATAEKELNKFLFLGLKQVERQRLDSAGEILRKELLYVKRLISIRLKSKQLTNKSWEGKKLVIQHLSPK